ncbi:MAG: ATP-binding protein [Xanthomonadales bacterium]|jgi:anti-sigma regulatory factor (Ser/Thr protein kinase)|nr:ATP-binding protein [Xanthomonadales bacterium]
MGTSQKILGLVNKNKEGVTADFLEKEFGFSRQYIVRLLNRLIAQGEIHRRGKTRAARYFPGKASHEINRLKLIKERQGLSEYAVLEEVTKRIQLNKRLNKNCITIFDYAFTEMLNNAIDHSQSKKVWINVEVDHSNITFTIKDLGIGAIENIKQGFGIAEDFLALEHLFKGRQTTAEEAHSGQGIFFTSKVVDTFRIATSGMEFTIDNSMTDEFLRDIKQRKGTSVTCGIKRNTRRKIKDVFDQYTGDDYEFNQNIVKINLSKHERLMSRSEAKRLLSGLDDYSVLDFNFQNVVEVGQGFCDEIFRVYANRNPGKVLSYHGASDVVRYMIERSRK